MKRPLARASLILIDKPQRQVSGLMQVERVQLRYPHKIRTMSIDPQTKLFLTESLITDFGFGIYRLMYMPLLGRPRYGVSASLFVQYQSLRQEHCLVILVFIVGRPSARKTLEKSH